ncbi:2-phospho-L-lactate guanylyltransferase [Natrarchaeobaculum sulfurireducens]|uniref:2-phospho-L-lactate guanylyltransferase n=1 Tax=Natrarchaeobaculum sulfurireducens TaxID=2044521 RepID=A0A346PUK8_9EURY|nr:2-phospho-L-lactate guanylyltransferase [Natrarchaeobaculum sulfurireducens]AXR83203.1 2-Phospho-l-lactate Guanylyltransferase CofC [Natrarchaeobaculum sulfurireducens]
MQVVVPFAAETPKTRLESVLSPVERSTVARAMLTDVVSALVETGHEPTVLSTASLADANGPGLSSLPAAVTVDDRPLTEAVNARLPTTVGETVAVVMADLALATPTALERLFSADADVVIAPGRGGGTNALVVRHPSFRVDYHGASYLDHVRIAREVGASCVSIDSFRLSTDIDEPGDLVEVLLHGDGQAAATLEELGFGLEIDEGRVAVSRSGGVRRQ